MSGNIDPRAVIADGAQIADDVQIGPYAIIGPKVKIGAGSVISPHAVIHGDTTLGRNTRVYQFATVGELGPTVDVHVGEDAHTQLVAGDNNTFREGVTVHVGTLDGGITQIGNNNLFMAYVHIGHDCVIGHHNIFVNFATLAGHVQVDDWASLSCFVQVHQYCRIGSYGYLCASSIVNMDVPPYIKAFGSPAAPVSINNEGLRRRDFDQARRRRIKWAFKLLYRQSMALEQVIECLQSDAAEEDADGHAEADLALLIDFLQRSERGIIR